MEELNLPVPFISQFDPQANADAADNCGPVSATMVLTFFGEKLTVNEFFEKTGAAKGALITIDQLKQAISSYGYLSDFKTGCTIDDIIALLKQGIAPIVLVHYDNLHSREDVNYKGPHFLVIDGSRSDTVFANDPDFFAQFRTDGDHHAYTMTDFLAAWSNCHLDGNPDNSLLIIYPKDKQPVQPAATPEQTAQIEAATVTQAPAQPQGPSLQDEYDNIQHLLLDLATFAGAPSIDDRAAMVEKAKQNIQDLKSVTSTDTQAIIDLKKEANDKDETITQLMGEIGTLKAQKQVLAEQIAETEKDDSKAVAVGRLAQEKLNDIKSGQADIATLVKSKKPTWTFIGQAVIAMKNQYEATILELKSQLKKKQQASGQEQPQITTNEEKPGLFDFLGF